MTMTLACGAECGIITSGNGLNPDKHWAAVGGVVAIETGTVRSGARSWAFAAAATNPYLRWIRTASPVIYGRFYFNMTDATPASTATIMEHPVAAGSAVYIWVTTGGVLQINQGATTVSGPTLSNDTWYGVEYEIDLTANPNVTKWRTWSSGDGWVDRSNVSLAQAATTCTTGFLGLDGPTTGLTVYADDYIAGVGSTPGADYSDTTPRGGSVLRLRPNADSTHSFTAGDFGYNAAGGDVDTGAIDVYTYLDDDDQTGITDFIRQKVIRATGYCAIGFEDTAETDIGVIAVTSTHHSSGTGTNQQSIRLSDDGWASTAQVWDVNDVSDTTAHYRHKVIPTPPSAGSWTPAKLNNTRVRFGFSGDVTDVPYWDSISIEYESIEGVGGGGGSSVRHGLLMGIG